MPSTYSTNARLEKPGASDRQWDVPINANTDAIDAMTAVGSLIVTPVETPSATLQVRVTSGAYIKADGTVGFYTGTSSFAVLASATTYLWLDGSGSLASGPAFPTSTHLRLAHVVAAAGSVSRVVDERVQCAVAGSGLGFVLKAGDTINGPFSVAPLGSGGGSPCFAVDPSTRSIGFFGVAPATQAPSLNLLTGPAGATVSDAVADVGGSFSQAALNNNFASLTAKVDALIVALKRHGLMAS